jgi:predicted nucleic acid-binding protein
MLLGLLPSHSKVFCDANVLTYAFLGADETSQLCSAFLKRSARREIELYTSSFQASHTIHRIMSKQYGDDYGLLTDDLIMLAVM